MKSPIKTYKIRESAIKDLKKQSLLKAIPILGLSLIAGLSYSYFNPNAGGGDPLVLMLTIPIAIIAVGIGLKRGLKIRQEALESFCLKVDEHAILRTQHNTPDINLQFEQIKSIVKHAKGNISIVGQTHKDIILIPPELEELAELEEQLKKISPITEQESPPLLEKYQFLLVVSILGLMGVVYLLENKILVGGAGVLVIGFLSWSLYKIQTSKNIDKKIKRMSWMVLLVLLSTLGIVIQKLTL